MDTTKPTTLAETPAPAPAASTQALDAPPTFTEQDIALSPLATPKEEYDPNSKNALSPFYSHPTTNASSERLKGASQSNLRVYETDLESGPQRFSGEHGSKQPCNVWPTRSTLIRQKRQYKKKRGCYPWNVMTKKQRILFNTVMALLVIGLVVGVAVGISRAVGGRVYKNDHENTSIE